MRNLWIGRMSMLSVALIIIAAQSASVGHCRGQAINMKGTVLVPLRSVFDSLGATTEHSKGTITATKGQNSVSLKIDSKKASRNGKAIQLPMAPRMLGTQTYVPLRFVGEAFNAQVNYDKKNKLVSVIGGKVPVELYVVSPAEALACDAYSVCELFRARSNGARDLSRRPVVPIALHHYKRVSGDDTSDSWYTIDDYYEKRHARMEREPRFKQLIARSGGKAGAGWHAYEVTRTGSDSLKVAFDECTTFFIVGIRGGFDNPKIDFLHDMIEDEISATYSMKVVGGQWKCVKTGEKKVVDGKWKWVETGLH